MGAEYQVFTPRVYALWDHAASQDAAGTEVCSGSITSPRARVHGSNRLEADNSAATRSAITCRANDRLNALVQVRSRGETARLCSSHNLLDSSGSCTHRSWWESEGKSMNPWVTSAIALLIAYLLGAIPTGYWVGKLLQGIDVRDHGSKSTGATNVLRTLGKGPAIAVLLVDVLKGAAAIAVARFIGTDLSLEWLNWLVTLAGLAAVLGHARSIWLHFSGGKSAATGLGVLLAMAWPVGLGAALVFGVVLALSRIVSLSSIAAALASIALMQVFRQPLPYVLLAVAGGLYVIQRHKTNIQRLVTGTEPRIGKKHTEP
jgi:acyl phosphate:glycerol-3-phosphate acyltransferase